MDAHTIVVSGDSQLRGQLNLILTELGHPFQSCIYSDEAIGFCNNYECNRAIIDQNVIEHGGLALAEELHRLNPSISILLIADDRQSTFSKKALGSGIVDVIYRPMASDRVMAHLSQFIESPTNSSVEVSEPKPSIFEAFRATRNPGFSARSKKTQTPAQSLHEPKVEKTTYSARHLTVHCEASRLLLKNIWQARDFKHAVLIEGEAGSEFELVARELVCVSGEPLHYPVYLEPNEITKEHLASLSTQMMLGQRHSCIVFIPSIENIEADNALALYEFIEESKSNKKSWLRFAFGYKIDTSTKEQDLPFFLNKLFELSEAQLRIQPLRDRKGDIPFMVNKTLCELATLHPFLRVRGIEANAMEYLENYIWKENFEQLIVVLRSAAASTGQRLLSVQQLEPLLTSDLTSMHFLESAADELLLPV